MFFSGYPASGGALHTFFIIYDEEQSGLSYPLAFPLHGNRPNCRCLVKQAEGAVGERAKVQRKGHLMVRI
jgi:hypothetical protein